ncbi:lasso peptide biosynthesis B2 protein [Saccharothrix sp. NPDC042600]|uniref:lasso peptide biosynthesis B2 protein n=1 Tax=Saccharothrix sp. NPDC042600 TaxID=3154492 RepID=UPI0033ECB477|nr:lasso peptide biosynthesis B2 protein [Saccharothrix mutabilis subsp. capreolus]
MTRSAATGVPDHLYWASGATGTTFVLDGRSGRWHVLNPAAATLWRELRRAGDVGRAIRTTARRYSRATAAVYEEDARRVAADLLDRGLVITGLPRKAPPARSIAGRPSGLVSVQPAGGRPGWRARLGVVVALVLLRLPFWLTVRLVGGLVRRCARPATVDEAVAAVEAVCAAADRHIGRVACLERSLAVVVSAALTRRRIRWVIGVAEDPVEFHAWPEIAGVMVDVPGERAATEFIKVFEM